MSPKKYEYFETNIDGWMLLEELIWLYEKAKEMKSILEVGSWMGRSTHALLSSGRPVVAVDHFRGSVSQISDVHKFAVDHDLYEVFRSNVGHFPNLMVMKMDSHRAAKFFKDKSIDMIFIDGDHEYGMVKRDIEDWLPKCKKLICGHDRWENGVPRALAESRLSFRDEIGCIWSVQL